MTTTRNLSNRSADFVSVRDFGAVGDGITDDTAAFQAAVNYVKASTPGHMEIHLQARKYNIAGTIIVDGPARFVGEGMLDFQNSRPTTIPPNGSWMLHSSTTAPMVTFTGDLGKNSGMVNIGIYQVGHPAPGVGWAPVVRNWVISNVDTYGTLTLSKVHFHNVYQGVNTINAARPQYEDITGQFFYRGFSFDAIYDLGKFEGLHAWTYWSENDYVLQWQQANAISITLLRVDGMWMDRIFAFAVETAVYVGNGVVGTGTARAVFINGLYADFTARALTVDATLNAQVHVGSIFHLGQAWPGSPTTALPNSAGVDVASGTNHQIQIANIYSVLTKTYAIRVLGSNNQVWIGNGILEQYDFSNSGIGACYPIATNLIYFGTPPGLSRYNAAPPYAVTGAPGGYVISQPKLVITTNNVNNPVFAPGTAGNLAAFTVEGEATAGVALAALTTGIVNVGATTNAISFYGGASAVKGTLIGAKGGNVALANLITYLAARGLLTDSTT